MYFHLLNKNNNEYYNGNGEKIDGSIYSQTKFNLGNLFLFSDLQYRYINYKIDGTDDNFIIPQSEYNFNFFNPKIGLLYKSNDNQIKRRGRKSRFKSLLLDKNFEAAKNLDSKQNCLVILPDSIRNYLSKFVDNDWMKKNNFKEK